MIQSPQDLYAIQELIWACRPIIIETGIAHGGSLVMSASMLVLLDYCDAVETGSVLDPNAGRRKVVGIDIEIRPHNRGAIDAHPLRNRIHIIEGSSIAPDTMNKVATHAKGYERVMVFLDSTTPTIMSSKNSNCTRPMSAKALIASSGIPESRICRMKCALTAPGAKATIRKPRSGNI